ncbi:MAG: hypothetical protein Q8N79_06090 [Candidatus Methanoperedens sp.]|nr:hypothetical protein [Candidatus Methanoperedens sp.]
MKTENFPPGNPVDFFPASAMPGSMGFGLITLELIYIAWGF